jgi:heme exporter protein D
MKTRSLLAELRSKQAREARRKAAQQMENTL